MNVAYVQATIRSADATMKGCKHVIEGGNFDVLVSAHCRTGCERYATLHIILATRSLSPTLRVGCQRRAPSRADDATTARKLLLAVADPSQLLIAPRSSRRFRSGCGQRCCVGRSCGKTCVDKRIEETLRSPDRNDDVTKTRMSRSLQDMGKSAKTSSRDGSRERCEWFHLQITDSRTGTVWCPCVARPTERGESENATKRCEVHERKQTHPGTTTVETRTLATHNAAARNCRNAFGMESLSWNPMDSGTEGARPKTEEQKRTLLVRCCRGTFSRGRTEGRKERGRDRGADRRPPCQTCKLMENQARKDPTTYCIRKDGATIGTEGHASPGAKNEPTGLRTKRETQEPGVTNHRASEEDREWDGSNGGSRPSDTTDATEDRSHVLAVLIEGPRRGQREVETGQRRRPLDEWKTKKTEEHTQLQGPSEETKEHVQPQRGPEKSEGHTQLQGTRQNQKQGWRTVQQYGKKENKHEQMREGTIHGNKSLPQRTTRRKNVQRCPVEWTTVTYPTLGKKWNRTNS